MIKLQTNKSRLVFKSGSPFQHIAEVPDTIMVTAELQKGFVNIGVQFGSLFKEAKPAIPEVKEVKEVKKGDEIVTPYRPSSPGIPAQPASYHFPHNTQMRVSVDQLPSYKQFLKECSELALKTMQNDCESGFEITGEVKI